jgi:hypothetical protein
MTQFEFSPVIELTDEQITQFEFSSAMELTDEQITQFEFSPVIELTDEQIKDIDYAQEMASNAYNSIMEAMQAAKAAGKMEIYRTLSVGAHMVDAAEREYHRKEEQ